MRVACTRRMLNLPLPQLRASFKRITQVQSHQKSWIAGVKKDTWAGSWISENIQSHADPTRWAEETANQADLVIMFIHGGGFRIGYSTQYMDAFTCILERLKKTHGMSARILSVDYGLSPEVSWPEARNDCIHAYRYLVHELSVSPSRIIVAGDSAGGNLTATTLLAIRDKSSDPALATLPSLPMPAGSIMISPWTTLEDTSPTYISNRATDIITAAHLNAHVADYLPNMQTMDTKAQEQLLRQPNISPLYATFHGFCPTLIVCGEGEIFRHDIEKLVKQLEHDQVKVDVLTRQGAPHIWILMRALATTEEAWLEDLGKLTEWCVTTVTQ
ncbi:hypothetical protein DFQ28_000178 [Apophysomyces sp. BC1034]|nr:hypothetical protein DFQ30_000130 [Apophysomyces sp. BC1015]KAG0168248.1 hypothetical protein DFQ29_010225 [Apophysomyces sp. BC1021]KAG0184078.1 hypothetical protein DFQ28_000178 [Apophysomyces sp. BC1034]